jgi:hypothetical protein
MNNDISNPGMPKALSKRISEDIDSFCQELYDDGHRTHLGASLIGNDCKRALWYTFRWVKHTRHSGRLYRLFQRGHLEEDRFVEWLEGIGCQVWAEDEKGNQFRISDVYGHFGGSLDGVVILPTIYGIEGPLLLEFKTSNTKGFKELQKKGVVLAKPQHHAQMSTYGLKYHFDYALYMCICKETDEIHVEIVKLDMNLGTQMIAKAESIISSQVAPAKLSLDSTYYKCKFCDFNDVCHTGAFADKNCRSCKHAVPIEDGKWGCMKAQNTIDDETILTGCDDYNSITNKAE